jgi:hypothetical protein
MKALSVQRLSTNKKTTPNRSGHHVERVKAQRQKNQQATSHREGILTVIFPTIAVCRKSQAPTPEQ